jgi:Mg-chelatase subunit ChlD
MKVFGCRLAALLAVVLTVAFAANAQSGRVQQTPTPPPDETVRIVTEEIKLNVLAFDENGDFFGDMTANDLVITENDVLHQPASVRRIPANVLIVMDTGGELRSVKTLDRTRRVAGAVVNALRPGDTVAILAYSDKAELVGEWTDDRSQALAAIRRANFGRRSAFVDALKLATDLLVKVPFDNKHLVLITDGTDSAGRSSDKFDAFQRLLATDISVHVLSYTSMEAADIEPRTKRLSNTPPRQAMPPEVIDQLPDSGPREAAKRPKIGPTINMDRTLLKTLKARKAQLEVSEKELEKLAADTNGEFILPSGIDEMAEKSALVASMIDASYVVTYMPKISVVETRGLAERTINVTSKRPGLIVQARRRLVIKM